MDREEFLDQVVDVGEKQGGFRNVGYRREVLNRLEVGATRFGDAYLTRDNLDELLNEIRDVGAYATLEVDRLEGLMRDDDWQEMRMAALHVTVYAALAEAEAHRFRRLRDELLTVPTGAAIN